MKGLKKCNESDLRKTKTYAAMFSNEYSSTFHPIPTLRLKKIYMLKSVMLKYLVKVMEKLLTKEQAL